jgi:isochorismate hydrolase
LSLAVDVTIDGEMKSAYFTDQTIEQVSADLAQRAAEVRPRRVETFQPQSSLLLVLDMQRYFLDETSHAYIPSAASIFSKIQQLIDIFHANDRPVVYTRHLNTAQDAGRMSTWWRELIVRENPFSEIDPRLNVNGSTVVEKPQYDAFRHTSLDALLWEKGIEQVVITGVMTHLCCETTARAAFMNGYDVFFVIDGTATYNLDLHWASLQNLAHGFAVPALANELTAAFGETGG